MADVPGLTNWDLKKGREAARYIRRRTEDNPWFAGATGALHSGPIDYDRQQPFVEKAADMNPENLTDPETAQEVVEGAQFWKKKGKTLAQTASCFVQHCSDDDCLDEDTREELMECVEDVKGIGRKTADLMREYLGDTDAVAVDRHVLNWSCNTTDLCPIPKKKGDRITDDDYTQVAKVVRETADRFDMEPTDLQVSVWVSGVCQARGRKPLYLGDDSIIQCAERAHKTLERFNM